MKTLDYDLKDFESLLNQGRDLVIDRFRTMNDAKAFCGFSPTEVRSWFDEPLPEEPMDADALLEQVKEKVMDTATMNMAPNMYAYVMAGGTQISIIAEMLATTINQNVGKWHLAPAINEIERRVIQWSADLIGYDQDAGGVMVSGGSAANLTGLTVARNLFFEKYDIRNKGLFGQKPFIVYGSTETHGCVDKSMELLGIGKDHYRKIPTLDDYTIDLELLRVQIDADIQNGFQPFCLIGNAGTVNSGAIDPLDTLADIANEYDLWYHVDGAYGGLAAAVPSKKAEFKGIERADSIAFDFHKWLYQPFEAGCTMVRNWGQLKRTYYNKASYLSTDVADDGRLDFNEHYFQLSRNAKALKVWMSYKAYGRKQIVEMIEKDIDLTKYLADKVDEANDFELSNHPDLGVVCFKFLGDPSISLDKDAVAQLNKQIIPALEKDGRVFITGTTLNNEPVIRACLINHRLQEKNVDFLVKVIREVGNEVVAKLDLSKSTA